MDRVGLVEVGYYCCSRTCKSHHENIALALGAVVHAAYTMCLASTLLLCKKPVSMASCFIIL
jgi:hypothetical protein